MPLGTTLLIMSIRRTFASQYVCDGTRKVCCCAGSFTKFVECRFRNARGDRAH